MPKERIQKLLSEAGVASRREAEGLVVEGRVSVNGRVIVALPCFVDPDADEVSVDGQILRLKPARRTVILLNKPTGVACSFRAEEDRPSVFRMVPPTQPPLHCAAPLNTSEGGLILLTNDGRLAQEMSHPRYRLKKSYYVEVEGQIAPAAMVALKRGVKFGRWRTEEATVRIIRRDADRTVLDIQIAEAKSGELRRILKGAGHKPLRLRRTMIGPLNDRGVKVGTWRYLNDAEVKALREAIWRR